MWNWLLQFFRRSPLSDSFGDRGESAAASFLEGLGYRIVERQMRSRQGELDLVALDRDVIVFVEVKTRTTTASGHPFEAVTPAKQRKMTHAALAYLKRRGWLERRARFDVISIVWPTDASEPTITHYVNAFEPTGFGQMYS